MKHSLSYLVNERFIDYMMSDECCEVSGYLSEIKFVFEKSGGIVPVICNRPNLVQFEQFIEAGVYTADQSNMMMDYVVHNSIIYNYFLVKVVRITDDSIYLVFAPKDTDFSSANRNKFNRIQLDKPERFSHNGLFTAISTLVYSGAIANGDIFALVEDPTSLSRTPGGALVEIFTIISLDREHQQNDESLKKHLIERISSVVD